MSTRPRRTLEAKHGEQQAQELDAIVVRGAAEHNLKSVNLEIPKKKLVVFTGVSGSGKSSLAFDTLYAEGQRRYVESLSSYARQFLGQMDKPKYESIRGLSPTISIEQKSASSNPRSTVGTVTAIADYMRVLFARVGKQHCHHCGEPVGRFSAQEITDTLLALPTGTRLQVLSPVLENRKGEHRELIVTLRGRGFTRARVNGEFVRLDEIEVLDKRKKHTVELVVDRVAVGEGEAEKLAPRLTDAVETALKETQDGVISVVIEAPGEAAYEKKFSTRLFHCGHAFPELSPQSFSFNSPQGMCPECHGLGTTFDMDPEKIVPDPTLSMNEGAVRPWKNQAEQGKGFDWDVFAKYAKASNIDLRLPWNLLSDDQREYILYGAHSAPGAVQKPRKVVMGDYVRFVRAPGWEGVIPMLLRRYESTQSGQMKEYYQQYFSSRPCPSCGGARLRVESRHVKVGGVTFDGVSRMSIHEAHRFFTTIALSGNDATIAVELLKEIGNRLRFLLNVGLGYLSLSRGAATLSGGESQRIRLASQVGSELTGVIYILDEPSIGLHQRDNRRLLNTLLHLRDIGNSVVVVEHDQETIESADWVVDFGPGAGREGGKIVAQGTPDEVRANESSMTGRYLSGAMCIETPKAEERRRAKGTLTVRGARANNLKNVTVDFPVGCFVAVTGPSGAGKSSLINAILLPALMRHLHAAGEKPAAHDGIDGIEYFDKVIAIDQKPIGRTPRSNPATYTKVFDPIRDVFAMTPESRAFGYDKGRFSFNVPGGRCEACNGDGYITVEMHFLANVLVPCEVCKGKRFNDATLRVRFKGASIHDVLEMSVSEALEHFKAHKTVWKVLKTLDDVGLGYIKLGQPATTLSGGEAQRIKLSRELARSDTGRTLYILDEPTTGLHFEDIRKLLIVLNRLVEAGNTVVVIEHNLDVVKTADWVIDLGPEGGDAGGLLIAEGTPEYVAGVSESYTGQFLAELLEAERKKKGRMSTAAEIFQRARERGSAPASMGEAAHGAVTSGKSRGSGKSRRA